MSAKGKAKAVDLDPAHLSAADDELDSFFVKKTKRRVFSKADSPVRSPSPILILSDSDDEDAKARAKKAKSKKTSTVKPLPAWTRTDSNADAKKRQRSAGRGSTEERKTGNKVNETITIDSSPEKDDGSKPYEPELTPPPEMSETKKAEIAQAVMSAIALRPTASSADTSSKMDDATSARPSTSAVDDVVKGYFRMVASPDMKATESEKDIERYEKTRTITMGKTQALNYAIGALAQQVRKLPGDIVVTYKGDKIYSTSLTPQFLGVEYDAEFVCFDRYYYERLEAEAQDKWRAAEKDGQGEEEGDDDNAEGQASQSSEPVAEISDKARITLVGDFGQVSAVVQAHVTAASLCKYYIKRSKQDKSLHDSYRLSLDGETLDPSTPFSDMGVEDGEQMDVVRI